MSQYAYILVVISLVFPFLLNKYWEGETAKALPRTTFEGWNILGLISKRKIHTTENINDVIAYINKTYHLGMLLSKDITDQLK